MACSTQQYCLRWNNHQSNLLTVFDDLLRNEAFTDVTLTVDGGVSVKCHKVVLAACSTYFQSIFVDLPCVHPIVVLKDVKYSEIKAILDYMYRGEVNVAQEQLSGLLRTAEALKVKGLVKENGSRGCREEVETSASPPPAITTSSSSSSGAVHSSGHSSPPHSNVTNSYMYGGRRSPTTQHYEPRTTRSHVWQYSGFRASQTSGVTQRPTPPAHHYQQQQHTSTHSGQSYAGTDNGFETSPLKRKRSGLPLNRDTPILRTVLGQGQSHGHSHADSSQGVPPLLHADNHDGHFRCNSNSSSNDDKRGGGGGGGGGDQVQVEHAHSPSTELALYEDEEKQSTSPRSYPSDHKQGKGNSDNGSGRDAASTADVTSVVREPGHSSYGHAQKPEWKRYKQYTRDDIMSAIEAVRLGMSALQASRKYGVPSRTLYDKVKKLGIPTSRPFKRGSNGSGACFPYGISGNSNGSIYGIGSGGMSELETDFASMLEGGSAIEPVLCNNSEDREPPDCSRAASPVMPSAKQQDQDEQEDQVEDLSVARKTDVRVIVPPTTETKDEETDEAGPDDRK